MWQQYLHVFLLVMMMMMSLISDLSRATAMDARHRVIVRQDHLFLRVMHVSRK